MVKCVYALTLNTTGYTPCQRLRILLTFSLFIYCICLLSVWFCLFFFLERGNHLNCIYRTISYIKYCSFLLLSFWFHCSDFTLCLFLILICPYSFVHCKGFRIFDPLFLARFCATVNAFEMVSFPSVDVIIFAFLLFLFLNFK